MAEKNLGATDEQELMEISEGESSVAGGVINPTTAGPAPTVIFITKLLCPSAKIFCK